MGGIPEHGDVPQPVDQTQRDCYGRQKFPQQSCGTKGETSHHFIRLLTFLIFSKLTTTLWVS